MGRIFYSMAGEGRGHATRVRTVVEELRLDHQVVLFAPSVAYQFLSDVYRNSDDVEVREIPGLQFSYCDRRLSYAKSIRKSLPYLFGLPELVNSMERLLKKEEPDLIVTDFEPSLPRAAKRLGLPFISFDHQHFLTTFDLSTLPCSLWLKAKSIAATIDLFYTGQRETIVSSFFSPGLRSDQTQAQSVGVMLRRDLQYVVPQDEGHLLVYLRRFAPPRLMEALRRCGCDVLIYGLGEHPRDGNLRYFEVNESGFLDDLINCQALISNAGNQLVGEALSLRKPVLAIPEEGNFEQAVNGHFLSLSGYGISRDANRFQTDDLKNFLDQAPLIRERINPEDVVGNDAAMATIRRYLPVVNPLSLAKAA